MDPWRFRRTSTLLLTTLVSLWGSRLLAAGPVTLDDAVGRALASNPGIAVARARVDRAEAEHRAARLLLPSDPLLEVVQGDDRAFADEGSRSTEVAISQEVEMPGKRSLRAEAAARDLDAAGAELRAEEARVVRDVRITFYELHGAFQRGLLAQELVGLNDDLVEAAARRLDAGDISRLEADLVRADAGMARAEASAASGGGRRLAAELAGLLGAPSEASTLQVSAVVPDLPASLDATALAARALQERPELVAATARRAAAEARRSQARRGYVPDPELRLALERDRGAISGDDVDGDPAIVAGIDSIGDNGRMLTFGVGIRLPVTGRVRAELALAEAELAEAGRTVDMEAVTIEKEVRAAAGAASQSWESVAVLRELVPTAERNLELLRTAYEAGQISLADYIVQKDRAIRVRRTLVDAEVELAVALAELDLAAGRDIAFATPRTGGGTP